MTTRLRSGLLKFRAVVPGSRIALVAPASPFLHVRDEFEAGVRELITLGFEPVYEESVFAAEPIVAGPADLRAAAFTQACARADVGAVLAVRGGYGSMETLPLLDPAELRQYRKAFVGYSDLTSVHAYLNTQVGLASLHGPMILGRLARGTEGYDRASFLAGLSRTPLGDLAPAGLEVIKPGEAEGPIFGGTLIGLAASFGTPFDFNPPHDYVLFLEDVKERPYRLRRALMQLKQSGRLARASAIVFGEMLQCDEPDGRVTWRSTVADVLTDFPGPILVGFPSGHTTAPFVSLPFGVHTRVVAGAQPKVVFEEAAGE